MALTSTRLLIRPDRRRGFTAIGLLIALVIILILSGHYLFPGSEGEVPLAKSSIDRARDVSYTANKQVLYSQVQIFKMNYPSTPVTIDTMAKAGMSIPQCPNCEWILTDEGDVYSTLEPPPAPQTEPARPVSPSIGHTRQTLQNIQEHQQQQQQP